MAATQRPATLASGSGKSGIPAWRTIRSWYMVARNDRTIPPAVERFMAQRAHATTVEINSSHAAPASHPADVADLILAAARSPRWPHFPRLS
jgi:pimeloyl-ACP methyl ester carboxylesterase